MFLKRLGFLYVTFTATLIVAACQMSNPATTARSAGWNHYGEPGLDEGEPIALGAVSGGQSAIIVEGTITEVCQTKGCWMRMTDGDDELFVRFRDYGFFVPRNAAGKRAVIHGEAVATMASVEELRHYAVDAGKSEAEIAAITEPQERITFYADSVYIEGDDLDEPHSE
jgi:hypothetical protein